MDPQTPPQNRERWSEDEKPMLSSFEEMDLNIPPQDQERWRKGEGQLLSSFEEMDLEGTPQDQKRRRKGERSVLSGAPQKTDATGLKENERFTSFDEMSLKTSSQDQKRSRGGKAPKLPRTPQHANTLVLSEKKNRVSSPEETDSKDLPRHRERTEKLKVVISRALKKANAAVSLDIAQHFEDAIVAYMDACNLLQQSIIRSSSDEDRRKLEAIRLTYTNRIEELQRLDPGFYSTTSKSITGRLKSNDSLDEDYITLPGAADEKTADVQTAPTTRFDTEKPDNEAYWMSLKSYPTKNPINAIQKEPNELMEGAEVESIELAFATEILDSVIEEFMNSTSEKLLSEGADLRRATGSSFENTTSSDSASTTPNHGETSSTKRGSQKRNRGSRTGTWQREDRSDENDENSSEDDDRRRKKGKGRATDPGAGPPRLRCPFFLHDPEKYGSRGSCAGQGFRDMRELNQHITRNHLQPQRCPRCQQPMKDQKTFRDHLKEAKRCEELPVPVDDRISQERWEEIKISRKTPITIRTSDEEKWTSLYKEIFPSEKTIPSPYEKPIMIHRWAPIIMDKFRNALAERMEPEIATFKKEMLEMLHSIIQSSKEEAFSINTQEVLNQYPFGQPMPLNTPSEVTELGSESFHQSHTTMTIPSGFSARKASVASPKGIDISRISFDPRWQHHLPQLSNPPGWNGIESHTPKASDGGIVPTLILRDGIEYTQQNSYQIAGSSKSSLNPHNFVYCNTEIEKNLDQVESGTGTGFSESIGNCDDLHFFLSSQEQHGTPLEPGYDSFEDLFRDFNR